MELSEILLTKEEVPMLYGAFFSMPIHPRLVSDSVEIDGEIAHRVFAQAADEWYDELVEYEKTVEDEQTKEWIRDIFLKRRPRVVSECLYRILDTVSIWRDDVRCADNGFARSLMINRNVGGSLYFRKDDYMSSQTFVGVDSHGPIRFSREKVVAYSVTGELIKLPSGAEGADVYRYGSHNMDHYPGALFLRNWSMLYLNEAMKQVLGGQN